MCTLVDGIDCHWWGNDDDLLLRGSGIPHYSNQESAWRSRWCRSRGGRACCSSWWPGWPWPPSSSGRARSGPPYFWCWPPLLFQSPEGCWNICSRSHWFLRPGFLKNVKAPWAAAQPWCDWLVLGGTGTVYGGIGWYQSVTSRLETSRYRDFSHFFESIGLGLENFGLEKKSRYRSRKYLVSKKSLGIGLKNI